MRVTLCAAVMLLASAGAAIRPVRAQSLGDVARQEEERRKVVKSTAKVYTNKDLSAPPPVSVPVDAPKGPGAAAEPPADAGKAADDKDKGGPTKGQAYWSGRKKELQLTLDRDKVLVASVQSRINALTADFSSRGDPIQRAGIERDRVQALGELGRLQQEIKDTQKALNDLDEEARKAGAPPGWLR